MRSGTYGLRMTRSTEVNERMPIRGWALCVLGIAALFLAGAARFAGPSDEGDDLLTRVFIVALVVGVLALAAGVALARRDRRSYECTPR